MNELIQKGDRVNVYFERVEAEYQVEIVSVPTRPHEAYVLRRMDGTIVHVLQYSKMVRNQPITKKPDPVLASPAMEAVRNAETKGPDTKKGDDVK